MKELTDENKVKLEILATQFTEILLELREIAPIKFHDNDCDNCVFNFLGVNYDEGSGEVHIDLAMWSDALENIHNSPYTVVETAGMGHVFLIKGKYRCFDINSPHEVRHYNLENSKVIAYVDRRKKTVNWPFPSSYNNHRTIAYAMKIQGMEADSDEEAVNQFKQLVVEERWV